MGVTTGGRHDSGATKVSRHRHRGGTAAAAGALYLNPLRTITQEQRARRRVEVRVARRPDRWSSGVRCRVGGSVRSRRGILLPLAYCVSEACQPITTIRYPAPKFGLYRMVMVLTVVASQSTTTAV